MNLEWVIVFLGMWMVAMMQIATIRILWISIPGTMLLPLMLTFLGWNDGRKLTSPGQETTPQD